MDNEREQLARKQLANWLRDRFEGHVPAEILARISDEDLCRQYEEDRARSVKMIEAKAAGEKIKVRIS